MNELPEILLEHEHVVIGDTITSRYTNCLSLQHHHLPSEGSANLRLCHE